MHPNLPLRINRLLQQAFACCLVCTTTTLPAQTAPEPAELSLQECIETALTSNRAIQIERINPEIARLALEGSYGYYDPIFSTEVRKERDNDTGGFDPADFSRDAIYSADSEVGAAGLTGFLPTGLSYGFTGGYAHSDGTRNGLNFDSYKVAAGVWARQPLLRDFWTDQGRTAIRVNKKLLKISELGLRYAVLDMVNQVQQAYYELAFTRENLAVRHRLLAAKEATLAGVKRQVEVGTLTVLEEKVAVSQVSRVEAELVSASNTVLRAENILKTLMGRNITNWDSRHMIPSEKLLLVPQPLELASSWERGMEQRPDLAQMKQDLERAAIDLRLRQNQLYPWLNVIASYGRRGSDAQQMIPPLSADASFTAAWDQLEDGAAPNTMLGVSFSTPLSRKRERNAYEAGKQLKEQAQLRLKQKEEFILREVSDAVNNARSARDRAQATQRAKVSAQAALEAEERKLAGGTSSLFFVFQLQSDLADVETAEVRARADYNKALSQLYFADGSLLDREGVTLFWE